MSLSVIVTSYRSRRILEACLTSLCRQPEARDIVVADCSPDDPSDDLHARFPNVRVVHLPGKVTVPVLRWSAVPATRGGVVAAIEARCVPSDPWCAELLGAHVRWPEAPAVGGPVDLKPDASPFDWGLYFAEFGAFAPPLATGASAQLSGANLSYKRAALIASQDLMDRGQWEAGLHERWRAEGRAPRLSASPTSAGRRIPPPGSGRVAGKPGGCSKRDRTGPLPRSSPPPAPSRGGIRRLLGRVGSPARPPSRRSPARCSRSTGSSGIV